jgi:hypothetical protein
MKGRPAAGDAASYYFTYIDQVVGDDCLESMTAQSDTAIAFFAQITEEQSMHRYAPGKWSIRRVLGHINDTERLFVQRAFWFARGLDTPLPSYDQDVAAAAAEADRLAWAAHLEEFRAVRAATLCFFRHLPEAAWSRRGVARARPVPVRARGFMVPGHLTHHMRLLRERYL